MRHSIMDVITYPCQTMYMRGAIAVNLRIHQGNVWDPDSIPRQHRHVKSLVIRRIPAEILVLPTLKKNST